MQLLGSARALHTVVIAREAGDPARRGLSTQSPFPLEYWVARSSGTTTAEDTVAVSRTTADLVGAPVISTLRNIFAACQGSIKGPENRIRQGTKRSMRSYS